MKQTPSQFARSLARTPGLPVDLIHGFWKEVESEIKSRHNLDGEEALRGIMRYRDAVERVGQILYHQTPRDVAAAVVGGGYAGAARKVS